MGIIIIIGIILVIIIGSYAAIYNGLVGAKNNSQEGWAQISVQLKRRVDLIPNLVNTVKGYAEHEKNVFMQVTQARSNLQTTLNNKNATVNETSQANNALTNTLTKLFAVAENYPELKASENFAKLQEELTNTENKVAFSRQYYNNAVRVLNIKIQSFPSNIVASIHKFQKGHYFEVDEQEVKDVPKVEF